MTDYDINKVSPRPWVVHRHPEYGFSETDGNKFTGVPILRAENRLEAEFLHAVHCVNTHDDLVTALEDIYNDTVKAEARFRVKEGFFAAFRIKSRKLLARAKVKPE